MAKWQIKFEDDFEVKTDNFEAAILELEGNTAIFKDANLHIIAAYRHFIYIKKV